MEEEDEEDNLDYDSELEKVLDLAKTRFPTARINEELKDRLDKLVEGVSIEHCPCEWTYRQFGFILAMKNATDRPLSLPPSAGSGIKEVREDAYWLSLALRENVSEHAMIDPNRTDRRKGPPMRPYEGKSHIAYDHGSALAYAMIRMPPIYAVLSRVFTEVEKRIPKLEPKSMLDFGSGPGTAIWAAREVWGDSFENVRAVEPNNAMVEMSEHLLSGTGGEEAVEYSKRLPPQEVLSQCYENVQLTC